ncbi:hypothetical protein AURDEDRAFT_170254 [Auricularia subglabra TFB-10046 SS5]|nr:hypothetical protein AURDEDRAFT_170254 [Auricularia subglabra TFB-10046 SS5]
MRDSAEEGKLRDTASATIETAEIPPQVHLRHHYQHAHGRGTCHFDIGTPPRVQSALVLLLPPSSTQPRRRTVLAVTCADSALLAALSGPSGGDPDRSTHSFTLMRPLSEVAARRTRCVPITSDDSSPESSIVEHPDGLVSLQAPQAPADSVPAARPARGGCQARHRDGTPPSYGTGRAG